MPNVSLPPALERDIELAITSGDYTSVSEIVREGLRLWKERRTKGVIYEQWLLAQIEVGWEQADRGDLEEHNMQKLIEEVLNEKITTL